ncbi:RimJ/RimL family protein N-acetyltransferase [Marisediminicola sp. UYEF4]|uniref:GNAT family N-acetyltransferase n=1 Tax=Marisediminicola sp. UYEF4 TaxID=1756384 RepID=UPI003397BB99
MIPAPFGPPVRAGRVLLRMMSAADIDDVYAYQGRDDVCRYLLFEARTREQVAEQVARHAASTVLAADGDYWQIAVVLPAGSEGTERVIGDIYFTLKSRENLAGEIGWTFHPDFRGRGYATEAASAVLRRAFAELGLHRVIAELDPRNDASIALCRRLGMREEAYFVKDLMFRGDWADTGIYAILDVEWAARSAIAG